MNCTMTHGSTYVKFITTVVIATSFGYLYAIFRLHVIKKILKIFEINFNLS